MQAVKHLSVWIRTLKYRILRIIQKSLYTYIFINLGENTMFSWQDLKAGLLGSGAGLTFFAPQAYLFQLYQESMRGLQGGLQEMQQINPNSLRELQSEAMSAIPQLNDFIQQCLPEDKMLEMQKELLNIFHFANSFEPFSDNFPYAFLLGITLVCGGTAIYASRIFQEIEASRTATSDAPNPNMN